MDSTVKGTEETIIKTAANVAKVEVVKDDKGFKKVLVRITKNADILAQDIHIAGLYALSQVNIHGQVSAGLRLIDAMGKKHDKVRVLKWLIKFGKFAVKDGVLVYKKRKDINPESVEAWQEKANATPYWELTAQTELTVTYDYYKLIEGILNKRKNVPNVIADGKQVTELNGGLLDAIQEVFAKFQPVVIAK